MEIIRKELKSLKDKLNHSKIVAILGPRQCGKTTLAKQFINTTKEETHFFDVEDYRDANKLENPLLILEDLTGIIIIDEIQLSPHLFPVLRVLADQKKNQKFIILGSASQEFVKQSSETLAGRISFVELGGFSVKTDNVDLDKLWMRGGFPVSYLSKKDAISFEWRTNFIRTFLERDIPRLGITIPSRTLYQFWLMISHFHGEICNFSSLGKSLGVSDNTIRKYLDILEGTFMVRLLRPWHYNTKKRIVKQPKLYIRDSGIFHALQSLETKTALLNHPKLGASWEGFALEQLFANLNKRNNELFFWKLHSGAELDLFAIIDGKPIGFEIKFTDSPSLTPSMTSAMKELNLHQLYIVHPGKETFKIQKNIIAIPLTNLPRE